MTTPPSLRADRPDGSGAVADGPLVSVRGLEVHFPIRRGVFVDRTVGHVRAVDGVDLDVPRGGTYGLVGESGCGKSTLGRALLRLVEPTAGSVLFDGVDIARLRPEALRRARRRMQMIFQDPMSSLDPRQNVESILVEGMAAHGLVSGRAAMRERVSELLDAVGLQRTALSRYPHEFSGGQRQRIGIARALAVSPDLIVADEPVSALDVSVQAQVLNLLVDLQGRFGLTYLVIAHDLAVVRHVSDTVGVMYLGGLVEEAPAAALYAEPLHPYTRALMSAVPVPDPVVEDRRERILLVGDLPSPAAPPAGCRFHTRCPWRQPERCDTERPVLREPAPVAVAGPAGGAARSGSVTGQVPSGAVPGHKVPSGPVPGHKVPSGPVPGHKVPSGLVPGHKVACHWAEDIRSGALQPRLARATDTGPVVGDGEAGPDHVADDALTRVEEIRDSAQGMA